MAMKHTSYCKTVVESGNRALAARRMSLGTTGQVGNIKVARFGGKTKTSFRVYSLLFSLPWFKYESIQQIQSIFVEVAMLASE